MAAAIALVCVDPRLNHELLRIQVRQKLDRLRLRADRIFIVNDVAGNVGTNFRNTVAMLKQLNEPLVFCAALHHDTCLAAEQGLRTPLATNAQRMATVLTEQGVRCPVLTGNILTQNNLLLWTDEPARRHHSFSMGRL